MCVLNFIRGQILQNPSEDRFCRVCGDWQWHCLWYGWIQFWVYPLQLPIGLAYILVFNVMQILPIKLPKTKISSDRTEWMVSWQFHCCLGTMVSEIIRASLSIYYLGFEDSFGRRRAQQIPMFLYGCHEALIWWMEGYDGEYLLRFLHLIGGL